MSPRIIKINDTDSLPVGLFTIPSAESIVPGGIQRTVLSSRSQLAIAASPAQSKSARQLRPEPERNGGAINKDSAAIATNAISESEKMLADVRNRAAQIENEARDRGLAEGRARASAEIDTSVEPLREKFAQSLAELAGLRAIIAERTERDLVLLALEIARKVVHREVTIDADVVLTLARVALSRLHNNAVARVHLHPDDFNYVTSRKDQLESAVSVEIVEDRSVARGGCLIQTEMGDIDARIEQQFAEIERGFMSA
jgi:flagellar assembly protein FliH